VGKAPPPPPVAKRSSGAPQLDASPGPGSNPANGAVRAPSALANESDDEELAVDDDELIDE
jgi:hypothetical protein